jgi:aspartyl/asparaginyl-tRNA synthetase
MSTLLRFMITEKGANGVTPEFFKFAEKLSPESVVDVYGVVVKAFKPVTSTTQQEVELSARRLYCVSASHPVLPFQIEDAARRAPTEAEEKANEGKESKVITVGTDLRLDNRWVDLRTPANHAIFRLQSRIGEFYRAYFIRYASSSS